MESGSSVATIDVVIVIVYMLAILGIGTYFGRNVKTAKDFFLAGKMLPWWVIGFSIIGTNIGSYDYMGAAGNGFKVGITQANYEWIGAIPAMIISALIFIPFYWRAGVYTVPEFLGRRYNAAVRLIMAIIWGLVLICFLGIFLYAAGLLMNSFLGWPVMTSIIIVAVIMGIYTVVGGLTAVVYTDLIQFVVMLVGSVSIMVSGFMKVGGISGLSEKVTEQNPEHLQLFLPLSNLDWPWLGMVFGLALVLSPAWWCCHQSIIQRTLGARSEWDAKAGMILATFPKTLFAFFIILPGFFVLALTAGQFENPDQALPEAIKLLLPIGLRGLMFAAIIAAIQSTVDSTLNSLSTIWTRDIYQTFIVKNATDKHYLAIGRWLTVIFLIGGILFAPATEKFPGIYLAMQYILSIFQGPTFAIMLLGIMSKRINQWGGLFGLIIGVISTAIMFSQNVPFLYTAWWSFVITIIATILISLLTKPDPEEKLVNLVYGLIDKSKKGDTK